MSAPKHTPGPWAVEEIKSRGKHVYWRIVAPTRSVAGISVEVLVYGHRKVAAPEIKANAFLISASPDLLSSVVELVARREAMIGLGPGSDGRWDRARYAIAKARGQ